MSYYQADGLGSVTSLSDSKGVLVSMYRYDSFGNLTASTGSISNPFRFTSREFDAETRFYFYRARYYSPSMGRFISEDPIGFAGGINFYVYIYNNPINGTDPYGLAPSFGDCLWKCMKEYFGLESLTALWTPIPKPWLGIPVYPGTNYFTNPLSLLRGPAVPFRFLNTRFLFRMLGRLNPYAFAGLAALDANLIGKCTYDCMSRCE